MWLNVKTLKVVKMKIVDKILSKVYWSSSGLLRRIVFNIWYYVYYLPKKFAAREKTWLK